jgi:hypothetical protein
MKLASAGLEITAALGVGAATLTTTAARCRTTFTPTRVYGVDGARPHYRASQKHRQLPPPLPLQLQRSLSLPSSSSSFTALQRDGSNVCPCRCSTAACEGPLDVCGGLAGAGIGILSPSPISALCTLYSASRFAQGSDRATTALLVGGLEVVRRHVSEGAYSEQKRLEAAASD